jgi:hypothetical protein
MRTNIRVATLKHLLEKARDEQEVRVQLYADDSQKHPQQVIVRGACVDEYGVFLYAYADTLYDLTESKKHS